MLIFSDRKHNEVEVRSQDERLHVEVRTLERVGIDFKTVVEVIEEINRYLPDDWRMTRKGKKENGEENRFGIMVILPQQKCFQLVGDGYRTEGNKIIYVVNSTFGSSFFQPNDLISSGIKGTKRITAKDKKAHSDIVKPNIYFFRPHPDKSSSPLFARQYEKIYRDEKGNETGIEYHRIHPLTKAGLDIEHYRWIKWTTTGQAQFTDYVDHRYHGRSYWDIKKKSVQTFASKMEIYNAKLLEYHIKPQVAVKLPTSRYELEHKFLIDGGNEDANRVFDSICGILNEMRLTILTTENIKEQTDIYFDDNQFSLYSSGASFRLREKKSGSSVVLKKGFSTETPITEGVYKRIEEEAFISSHQKEDILKGSPINTLPYRLISYIAPYCDPNTFLPRLKLITKRKRLVIRNEDYQSLDLCFDSVLYEIHGKKYGPYFEVEIENIGMQADDLKAIADLIKETQGLRASHQTKYERGVSLLRK